MPASPDPPRRLKPLHAFVRLARQRVQLFVAGSAFLPASIVIVCLLVAVSGTQVVQLFRTASAAGWWTYHDPVTFAGPGLDGATTSVEAFVLGAVAWPGAYVLPLGSRVADLVAAAGGLLPEADAGAVSETTALAQGQRVYVPYHGQPPSGTRPILSTSTRRLWTSCTPRWASRR
jgi:hypothetical protein